MFKKLLVFATLFIFTSCASKQKEVSQESEDGFLIEDQIVEETSYQTIDDEQEAQALSEEERTLDVAQVEDEDVVPKEVDVKDRIFFGYDSAIIGEESAKILDTQAAWLKNDKKISVTIEGHCDERGTREYNIALGEKRALAAKQYLEKAGIDPSRLKTISYGKERPASFGTSEDVHAKNRRAVVIP